MTFQSSSNSIECELRGPITWNDFTTIKNEVEREWAPLLRTVELVIFAKGNNDFRIKIDNFGAKLVLKYRAKAGEARFEREVAIRHKDVPQLIEIMHRLGERQWVMSYVEKYEAHRNNSSVCFKFGSQIGDFFEIEEMVAYKDEIPEAIKKIRSIADKFGLQLWNKKTFEKITSQSWENVKPEQLISEDGSLHPLVSQALNQIGLMDLETSSETIAEILKRKDNDYTPLEKIFRDKIGHELISSKPIPGGITFSEDISIIIPTYNSGRIIGYTLQSIQNQVLNKKESDRLEVIVIDDGSTDSTSEIVRRYSSKLNLKYVRQNHLGRSQARNLGSSLAEGEILIFLDSDVILEKHFVREHAIRHSLLNNVVLISFKENISSTDKRLKSKNAKPDINHDFRFIKEVKKDWLRMHRHVRHIEVRTVKLLEETNSLKQFGTDKVLGVWDLPSVVVTNALSIKKKHLKAIGGFNLQFRGWGMEDTLLGACLIALGCYVVPVYSTGIFHINHGLRSGSKKSTKKEFNRNVLTYLDIIHQPVSNIFKK